MKVAILIELIKQSVRQTEPKITRKFFEMESVGKIFPSLLDYAEDFLDYEPQIGRVKVCKGEKCKIMCSVYYDEDPFVNLPKLWVLPVEKMNNGYYLSVPILYMVNYILNNRENTVFFSMYGHRVIKIANNYYYLYYSERRLPDQFLFPQEVKGINPKIEKILEMIGVAHYYNVKSIEKLSKKEKVKAFIIPFVYWAIYDIYGTTLVSVNTLKQIVNDFLTKEDYVNYASVLIDELKDKYKCVNKT